MKPKQSNKQTKVRRYRGKHKTRRNTFYGSGNCIGKHCIGNVLTSTQIHELHSASLPNQIHQQSIHEPNTRILTTTQRQNIPVPNQLQSRYFPINKPKKTTQKLTTSSTQRQMQQSQK